MMPDRTSPRLPLGTLTTHRLVSFVVDALERVATSRERRRTLSALRRLDAAQLADIGLTPEALERFARGGRV